MKIPKELKIGGHIVKIIESKNLKSYECGYTDFDKNEILIHEKLSQSMKELTLIHEIFHFMNSEIHSENSWSHALLESLSQQIYQVLKDNKFLK